MLNFKNIGLLTLYALINTLLTFGVISIINKAIAGHYSTHESAGTYIVFFSFVIFLYLLNVGVSENHYKRYL